VIVGSIVLVGSTMIAGDVEGVAVGNDDGDSVVGTDEVQATRISRINNQKNERIKQTSSSRCAGRWPALYDLRLEPIVSPGPHSLLAPISSPTAPVRRMVGPSTMGQK